QHKTLSGVAARSLCFLDHSSFIALLRTGISLTPSQPIDGTSPRNGDHPAEWFASFRRITIGFFPDLNKNFLQNIVGFGFFMNNPIDGGSQFFAVPAI